MMRRDRFERLTRRAYRALLAAYPSDFRDEMGLDVEETFVDRLRVARHSGSLATLRCLVFAVADVLGSGIRERLIAPRSFDMFHWQDVRYALRLLRKNPVLSLLTVVVLGGGLGVSIFTFSFLYTTMLRPLPVQGGDRIVRVSQSFGPRTTGIEATDLARMRGSITTLTDIGAYTTRELVVGEEGGARRRVIRAAAAEWGIFQTTGTRAALGRGFRPGDAARGAEPVIVLSHRMWQLAFGGDSSVVGGLVPLNGTATRVIGVMPAGYGFPVAAEAWIPLGTDVLETTTPGTTLDVYARLARGVSARVARAQVQVLADRALRERPTPVVGPERAPGDTSDAALAEPMRINVQTFPRAQMGDEGPLVFAVLNLLAALILLLACVNVINLLLARANDRAREMAVRLALGASRARLVVQSLWETAIITVAGGALATALTAWGLGVINRWAQVHIPGNLAFWWVWRLDPPALVAAGVFVTLTTAALAAVVAARATNVRINAVLQDSSVRGGGRRQSRMARALVVTQVATVSVLMFVGVMSGIVANRVATMDLGFDTRNLMSTNLMPPTSQYDSPGKRITFYRAVYDAMVQAPEVELAALRASIASLNDAGGTDRLELDRGGSPGRNGVPRAFVRAVLGPTEAMGSTLVEGRAFDGRDDARGAPTAIVSRSFAARNWPGTSPIGREVRLAGVGETEWRTVVGVVSDVPLGNPLARDRSTLAVYVPLAQRDEPGVSLIFRHRGNATAAVARVHRTLGRLDPSYAPDHVATFDEILDTSALMARSVTKLFMLCFGFALLLAVSGTYALMAQSIGQRTREIGVRRALGATDGVIVRLLVGQGGRQLGLGAALALPVVVMAGILLSRYFPIAVGISIGLGVLVAATIVGVVLAATYVPTRRVLRVPPRQALWQDS